jgi:S-DNA-T family DNA segregation ATPase FtsK/SpoIIIE
MLAAAIFIFLCNFSFMGEAGDLVSKVMFGLFGLLSYVTPLLFFFMVIFAISNRGSRRATQKIVAGVFFYLAIGIICELFVADFTSETLYKFGEIYKRGAETRTGGGIIPAWLAFLGERYIGIVGTVLVVLVVAIIAAIVLTNRSLFAGVKSGGEKIRDFAEEEGGEWLSRSRESAIKRREESAKRREKEEQEKLVLQEEIDNEKILRRDKKVSGVMADTKLTDSVNETPKIRENMHEINLNDFDERLHVSGEGVDYLENININSHNNSDFEIRGSDIHEISLDTDKKRKPKVVATAGMAAKKTSVSDTRGDDYIFPPIEKLILGKGKSRGDSDRELKETAAKLQQTLLTFGVKVTMTEISQGPAVTRYEMQPEEGVKVSKIVGLHDDIKLNLAATDIRIEAPIPGKAAIGIEVPNKENSLVYFRELIESREFQDFPSDTAFAVGRDIGGRIIVDDIARMPHMLIAGATGSGKSVCINTLIMSLLYKAHPDDVKMIMIDPKVVELNVYNGIPHLLVPVVTDPRKAAAALQWGVLQMTERYHLFAEYSARDLRSYNKKVSALALKPPAGVDVPPRLPQIIIIVDELADLMMVAPRDVEELICRLAQLGRAAGIHLIVATQRPSVDVITGLIKANMPSRIAFNVASGIDSRTILDKIGAESLLGKGDMLYYPQGYTKPARIQGAFVTEKEVADVVAFLKEKNKGNVYSAEIADEIENSAVIGSSKKGTPLRETKEGRDDYFESAGWYIIETDKATAGDLQRKFAIGFNRAARILDELAAAGVVGPSDKTKARQILMNTEQFAMFLGNDE